MRRPSDTMARSAALAGRPVHGLPLRACTLFACQGWRSMPGRRGCARWAGLAPQPCGQLLRYGKVRARADALLAIRACCWAGAALSRVPGPCSSLGGWNQRPGSRKWMARGNRHPVIMRGARRARQLTRSRARPIASVAASTTPIRLPLIVLGPEEAQDRLPLAGSAVRSPHPAHPQTLKVRACRCSSFTGTPRGVVRRSPHGYNAHAAAILSAWRMPAAGLAHSARTCLHRDERAQSAQ